MQVSGTYFQIVDFANRLNASPRLVVLDKSHKLKIRSTVSNPKPAMRDLGSR